MLNNRLLSRTAGKISQGGFTLVELLVVIGIIAILAGSALGPITHAIQNGRQSVGLQNVRTIGIAEFQFSNDNTNYPDGADAGAVAQALLTGKYITDPKNFIISGGKASPVTPGAPIQAANVDYDFAGVNGGGAGSTTTYIGVNSNAPDQLPIAWSSGEQQATIPVTALQGMEFTPTGGGPFGKAGIAIMYKSNSAAFARPATQIGPGGFPAAGQVVFVDQSFDPAGTQYQVRMGGDSQQ
jgi:prepilin-type N-terminal cleavage/methylation domain-containing protein